MLPSATLRKRAVMACLYLLRHRTTPKNRPLNGQVSKPTKNRRMVSVGLFVGAFIFMIYIFPLINSSFYYFFTKNILSSESGADSPRSGCEAATQCTKTYTVSRRDVPNGAKVCRYMRSIILRSCGVGVSYRDRYHRRQALSHWAKSGWRSVSSHTRLLSL